MIFQSKKATMTALGGGLSAIAAILVPLIFSLFEHPFSAEEIKGLTTIVVISIGLATGTYNVGQGLSDFKKEAAKEQARSDAAIMSFEFDNAKQQAE